MAEPESADHTSRGEAQPVRQRQKASLAELAGFFSRLGFTAFGGPAAHIAIMRQEVVERRKWMSNARFVDLIGVTNMLPGPSSTELALYLGYLQAGWLGLLVAGVCFISPAALCVLALAWAYVTYGSLPQVGWLFYGIQPVVVAIIAQAIWNLGRTIFKSIQAGVLAVVIFALYLLGVNILLLLLAGAGLFTLFHPGTWRWLRRRKGSGPMTCLCCVDPLLRLIASPLVGLAPAAVPFSLLLLLLLFLKMGAIVYGSGYTLLAFLRTDLVQNLHWLTDRQLLDAVSIGQLTPGPVFTTATFIGYVLGGWIGALLATLGIFCPSFLFIVLIHPVAARLRQQAWTAAVLDGVNVAALALMAGVLLQIGQHALVDLFTWLLALLTLALLFRFRWNSAWLILAGAAAGLLHFWVLHP
ncbi:MAG TPA: chromate efflux transporter [Ktedonobacteraceae bacterium]|jgi:chromate transporter